MNHKSVFALPLFVVAVLGLSPVGSAQVSTLPDYQLITTIQVPSNLASFDISWIDQGSQKFYLADRGTGKGLGVIDVIDTQTNQFLYTIPSNAAEIGFAGVQTAVTPGCSISGPNGVVAIPYLNQLYVGDGDSTVK